jgi:DNA modification methylase
VIFIDDLDFHLHVGDALDVLREMPDESVHCVVTSPPYWGLRDYGTGSWTGGDPDCDHLVREDPRVESSTLSGGKATTGHQREGYKNSCPRCGATRTDQQLGLEPTPDAYIARMVQVFRQVRRVLRRDGTCWLNIGDSYNAYNGGAGPGSKLSRNQSDNRPALESGYGLRFKGLKPKDLVGIPWRLAFALQADGWYLRSDIIWAKPNPMPESVTDRPTKSHEYVFLLTREARYFYDAEAIRENSITGDERAPSGPGHLGRPASGTRLREGLSWDERKRGGVESPNRLPQNASAKVVHVPGRSHDLGDQTLGRNARSVWTISTQPYAEAHFATFPEELPRRCISAGTSERGCCPVCGAPWEREGTLERQNIPGDRDDIERPYGAGHGGLERRGRKPGWRKRPPDRFVTSGWRPTCDCSLNASDNLSFYTFDPVPCTVLDPFMGSGTVALVARKLGRKSIGIELNPEYAELCARRLQQQSLFACVVDESAGLKDTIG